MIPVSVHNPSLNDDFQLAIRRRPTLPDVKYVDGLWFVPAIFVSGEEDVPKSLCQRLLPFRQLSTEKDSVQPRGISVMANTRKST
jgi:hypothetical protein